MKEQIIKLFLEKAKGKGNYVFSPEIKVRRSNDIIYISEIKETYYVKGRPNYFALVEVGTSNDKAPVPFGLLDDLYLKAILLRLQGAGIHQSEKLV